MQVTYGKWCKIWKLKLSLTFICLVCAADFPFLASIAEIKGKILLNLKDNIFKERIYTNNNHRSTEIATIQSNIKLIETSIKY